MMNARTQPAIAALREELVAAHRQSLRSERRRRSLRRPAADATRRRMRRWTKQEWLPDLPVELRARR
jgi:hypothetical protein